ncbi:serine/threonine-protein kinase [Natranaerofaba carboxydovora]|uniref:serine/threonine-protein kinase n=1 Tax=Natranaerofaba carboxydovora TaxID=2742683 RepID=UPI001F12B436|nr:serine/threonine-protein kinase [Natranaerofaba carboxydovora]UMZ74707.1 Serine/threonine-protein kinase PknB [Natranaerofaba carboxydovora]
MQKLSYNKSHNYTITKTIYETQDGESKFFEAFDEEEKRKVGIKSLDVPKKDLQNAKTEAQMLNYFANKTTSIPALYSTYYDEKNERFYLIMQLIEEGRTLEQLLKGKLPLRQGLQIMINLCDSLSILHQKKYQHRDLKPANIMVQKNNQVYLIDFNLSTRVPFAGEGTDFYRAPEQSEYVFGIGQDRADIFSVGVLLYEIATGEVPAPGKHYQVDFDDQREWKVFYPPKDINNKIPGQVSELIEKCMKLNPEERPKDANQLKRELIKVIKGVK